jgi:hypothetical protein
MSRSKLERPASNWQKLVYVDKVKGPCVDLIIDTVKRQYSVPDLVSLVYHGPAPANHVSRVIDTSKPCTPDNVGWISKLAATPDQLTALPDRIDGSATKKIKRRMIRPKMRATWNDLFFINDGGALYLDGNYDGQWKQYLITDYLSIKYVGPWPARDSYAFIIDMSKPIHAINVAWMTQNPDYRNVYG